MLRNALIGAFLGWCVAMVIILVVVGFLLLQQLLGPVVAASVSCFLLVFICIGALMGSFASS